MIQTLYIQSSFPFTNCYLTFFQRANKVLNFLWDIQVLIVQGNVSNCVDIILSYKNTTFNTELV